VLAVAAGLACAACTSGPSQSKSPRPRPSTVSPVAHPLLTKLYQQTDLVHFHRAANPTAVTVLTSTRNLLRGQQGAVLTVPRVGNLVGSCNSGHPAVTFQRAYRGPGPPTVTEVGKPLARPIGLYLLGWAPTATPVGGKQQLAFFQIVAGGEEADFALALWATLTPVAGGCAFSTNGVLRVRCSAPSVADIVPICSYVFRRGASTHSG
jgi:hypothetical protein